MTQITLMKFLEEVEAKQIPPEKWNINLDLIFEGYKKQQIDKETTLYILKELYYNKGGWVNLGTRKKCIKYIVSISKVNKDLRSFLEEIFITEYWYPIRLKALSYLTKLFPKFAYTLFNHISSEGLFDSYLKYILEKESYDKIKFLIEFIKDPLIKLFIYLKEKKDHYFRINISKRKILFYSNTLKIGNYTKYKRFHLLKELNEAQIKTQPIKSFVWKKRDEDGTIYENDPKENHPVMILYYEKDDKFKSFYCINLEFIQALIESIKKAFGLPILPPFKIIKTTVVYLILEIEEIEIYLKYRLMKYRI